MTDLLERLQASLAGRYTIECEIGRGGMATVFLAEDLKHHRKVAIKVLHPELSAAVGPDRFLREIEAVAGLTHPHVLPLFDSGEADGLLYYIMPYVEGESLRQRLQRQTQLPVDDAIRIAREVAEALDHAHRHGLIHRDIKPANILLEEGHPLVTDFGIARAIDGAGGDRVTATGMALGTPAYMSPEQAAGDDVDERSDIYSLGCVLYEMLAGEPPFTGSTPQAIQSRRLTTTATPLPLLRETVPERVDEVAARALAKLPADRYATGAEFEDALATASLRDARDRAPTATRRSGRRAAVVLAGLAAAIGAILLLWPSGGPPPGPPRVAVLPAEYRGSPEEAYIADDLASQVQVRLASTAGLFVPAFYSAAQYDVTGKSYRQIGEELSNAQHLLHMTVSRTDDNGGGRLRITCQLIRVEDEGVEWSESSDEAFQSGELFELQTTLAGRVSGAVLAHVGAGQQGVAAAMPTRSQEAWDYYSRGLEEYGRGTTREINRRAARLLERAVEADSTFALAHARLAELYVVAEESCGKARTAAERARSLDPELPEADLALAHVADCEGDHELQYEYLARYANLRPNDPEALLALATLSILEGRWREVLDLCRRAADLEPRSAAAFWYVGGTEFLMGNLEEAEASFHRVILLNPDVGNHYGDKAKVVFFQNGDLDRVERILDEAVEQIGVPEVLRGLLRWGNTVWWRILPARWHEALDAYDCAQPRSCWVARAQSHEMRGDLALARAYYDSIRTRAVSLLVESPDDFHLVSDLVLGYAGLGQYTEARRALRRAAALPDPYRAYFGEFSKPFKLARLAVRARDHDFALAQLEILGSYPDFKPFAFPRQLEFDPLWEPLRDEPRFQALLEGTTIR